MTFLPVAGVQLRSAPVNGSVFAKIETAFYNLSTSAKIPRLSNIRGSLNLEV
jgi:hypothetical protein